MITEANMLLTAIRKVIRADVSYARHEDREIFGRIFHEVTASFVSTKQDPYVYHVHTSWWEMFKDAYAPEWFKRRWPVKKQAYKVDVKLLYPHLKSELPIDVMGDRICLALYGPDRVHFSMFEPDGHMSDYRAMAEADLLINLRGETVCKCCGRAIRV